MDEEKLRFFKEFESACLEGTVDIDDSASVEKFLSQSGGEETYDKSIDDKMSDIRDERENLKLKIREEKKKGKYTTFHDLLLRGKLKTSDPFVMDILCKMTIKNDREKIKTCKECRSHERCPKRLEITRREKNGFHGDIKKELRTRKKILDTFDEIRAKGTTYESAKSDTLKKLQISGRTFDKYYKTRDEKMDTLEALRSILK